MQGQLISVKEASKRLKISPSQVKRLCTAGILKHQRVGQRAIWIDPASLEAATARPKVGRPKVWRFAPLVQELRNRGYEAIARKVEAIFRNQSNP